MKLQAKDCANGGIFQMEPERSDGTATRITHTLGADAFYFDNPNFRAREGDVVPYKDTTATVTARINIGSDLAPKLVARDSPQVATRVTQGCVNSDPRAAPPGGFQTVDHCGGVSVWDVRQRRPHGRRDRRGRDRGRPARHDLHAGLPGPEPGPRPGRRARLPVPGAGREPPEPALPGLETGGSTAPVLSGAVLLTLDHLILRAADPRATLAELADRLGAPVLAPVEEVAGLASGILRAGALDLEVLRVGATPPAAGVRLRPRLHRRRAAGGGQRGAALARLSDLGAGAGDGGRPPWRALQVHGLLPDPFPVPATPAGRA